MISSSSIYCLHSSCAAATNFRMSLNCANSSSTVTLFLLEKNRSSLALLFLRSVEYSFCLLPLTWDNLYSLPFHGWFLHSFFSAKTTLALLNFTVLFQHVQFLLIYLTWKVVYSPPCIIWKICSITLMHSNWWCMWLICTKYIIRSCSLVLLLELLHLLQRHLCDQVYKLLQCNFILRYMWLSRGSKDL